MAQFRRFLPNTTSTRRIFALFALRRPNCGIIWATEAGHEAGFEGAHKGRFREYRNQGVYPMRKIVLAAAIAGAALSLSACSEGTEDATEAAAEGAMADAEANMDAAGETMENAAAETGAAVDGAMDETAAAADEAAAEAEASIENESEAEAQAD